MMIERIQIPNYLFTSLYVNFKLLKCLISFKSKFFKIFNRFTSLEVKFKLLICLV